MAEGAICRVTGLEVVGVGSSVEVLLVARVAIRRRTRVLAIDVALFACYLGMKASQWIVSKRSVIELGIQPVRGRMTATTIMRKPKLQVAWVLGGNELLAMAGVAIRCGSFEFVIDMAGIAIERCMHPGQCETSELQMIKLRAKPRIHGVTRLAGRREAKPGMIEDRRLKVLDMAAIAVRG